MIDPSHDEHRPGRGSIQRRLVGWGLALLAVALVLNTFAGLIYTRRGMLRAAAALQAEVAVVTARRIQSFLDRKIERLQDSAAAMTMFPPGGAQQRRLGLLLMKNDIDIGEVAILDSHGREALKFSETQIYLPTDLQDQRTAAAFLAPAAGDIYVGPVRISDRAEPSLTLAVPVKVGPQNVVGVLQTQVSLRFLGQAVAEVKFGHRGYAYLVNESGLLIAHADRSVVLKYPSLHDLAKVQQFLATRAPDRHPGEEGKGITGEPVLSSYAPIAELGWAVVVEEPLELILADLQRIQRYAVLLLVAGLVSGAVILMLISRKITQPIHELRRGVEIIRSGELGHRAHIKTGDEIEELAEEFNKMTDALQDSYATLEQKVEQRTQEVSALYDVTTTVNQSLDLDSVLQAVIKKITQIFHFDATRVFLYDPGMEALKLRASFETNPEPWVRVSKFKRGESVVGKVAALGEPVVFEDIEADPRYLEWSTSKGATSAGMRFLSVFPVQTKSRIFGAIAFSGKERRKLTDEENRLLTSMAEHVGVAVEKASLFEQVKTRSEHLEVLNAIGAAVSQSLDLDIVLKDAVEKVVEALRFDACWIYILEPTDGHLRLKAHKGFSAEIAQSMDRRRVTVGISGKIFQTGQPLIFEDVQNDPRYKQMTSMSKVSSLGLISSGGFPIKAKDNVIGVLHVANKIRRQIAAEECQLLESIAQEIGVAVANARLFSEIKEKTSELVKSNRELLAATRAKSEFIAAMSHELRTPINIIMGNAELTGGGFYGDINSDQKGAMDKVYRNAQVLLKMINDVLALSRIEAKKMSLDVSTVDVKEVIVHAQTHVEQMNRDNHLEVRWDIERNVPPIRTDPIKLEEILQNLIGNAFKFTPKGRVVVQVRHLHEQDRVEFIVADTGIGIEAKHLGKIFEAFEQLTDAHTGDYNGVGLGLSIVRQYLELMQGDIRVESEPGRGSTFTFTLPRSVSLPSDSDYNSSTCLTSESMGS